MGALGSNPGQVCARRAPYLLSYLGWDAEYHQITPVVLRGPPRLPIRGHRAYSVPHSLCGIWDANTPNHHHTHCDVGEEEGEAEASKGGGGHLSQEGSGGGQEERREQGGGVARDEVGAPCPGSRIELVPNPKPRLAETATHHPHPSIPQPRGELGGERRVTSWALGRQSFPKPSRIARNQARTESPELPQRSCPHPCLSFTPSVSGSPCPQTSGTANRRSTPCDNLAAGSGCRTYPSTPWQQAGHPGRHTQPLFPTQTTPLLRGM